MKAALQKCDHVNPQRQKPNEGIQAKSALQRACVIVEITFREDVQWIV